MTRADMSGAPCTIRAMRDLSGYLRDALLSETPAFFESLYDVDGITDADVRPLVAAMHDDSMRFFRMAREKLKPKAVELQREEQRGSSWIVRFVLDGRTELEIVVDDVYERDGALHTRDVIRLRLPA